jgi:AraC-like DNA-binding protein
VHLSSRSQGDVRALDVSPLDEDLLDATVRLIRLLDSPAEERVLRPLITREIIYRLLMGDQGNRLRHLALLGGRTDRIAEAVERLRRDFDQPLRIDSLARELGMSVSGFHHHFKAVTAMSPLQFQKQVRLHEARRILLGESLDAAPPAPATAWATTTPHSSAGSTSGCSDSPHAGRGAAARDGAGVGRDRRPPSGWHLSIKNTAQPPLFIGFVL